MTTLVSARQSPLPSVLADADCLRTVAARFHNAEDVYLVGEFNNWSTSATRMMEAGNGLWTLTLRSTQAVGRFCFFVWEKGSQRGRFVEREVAA